MCPLPLLPFGCLLGIAQPFGGSPLKSVEVTLVAGQLAAVQVQDVRAHHVQEVSSVRHHHERLGPFHQVVLQARKDCWIAGRKRLLNRRREKIVGLVLRRCIAAVHTMFRKARAKPP